VSARIYRSLFDTARQYRESIDVYGSKASVEWPLVEHEPLILHRAKLPEPKIPKAVKAPDYAHFGIVRTFVLYSFYLNIV